MQQYMTVQGDTFDLIAYNILGSEKYMRNLILANRQYVDTLVFSSGIILNIPEIKTDDVSNIPSWRTASGSGGVDITAELGLEADSDYDEDEEELEDEDADVDDDEEWED